MEAVTGIKPATGMPKQLENVLEMLLRDNSLLSWSLYSEKSGSALKIRFREEDIVGHASRPADQHANRTQPQHYARKSPSKLNRDIHRAKRQRVSSSTELVRTDDTSINTWTLLRV